MFTTPGYKGLGQESSFHRAQGERQAASCANSSSEGSEGSAAACRGAFPTFLTGQTVALPSKLASPTGCLGERPSHLPCSVPLPKEAAIFRPRGLGKCGTQPRVGEKTWQSTEDCGPSCTWLTWLCSL